MTKCLQISLIAEQKQAGQGLNTFSWVICKCQSGNGAEREGGKERNQENTVATSVYQASSCSQNPGLERPGQGKAARRGREGWSGEEERRGEEAGEGTEPRNRHRKEGGMRREGGCGWRMKRVNQEKQFK